jgi:DNA invertase Pin-like site-specific DNA recombinase
MSEPLVELASGRPRGRPPGSRNRAAEFKRGLAAGLIASGRPRREIARQLQIHRSTLWRWFRGTAAVGTAAATPGDDEDA